jgi:glycosyltransferase involved in cell wall biosynthesis
MTTPRFSILIPTRDRPATLRHTLATVASQPGDDYEIVVADNCGSPETRRLVEELALPNIRYLRSDEVLPMAENWERGLAQCRGEYLTVLGDDDGFLPSTLHMARRIIAATEPEMVCWPTHTYWWPDTIVHWLRNLLVVYLGNTAMVVESRPVLERLYRGELSLLRLPMIYSGFYHCSVIEEARQRYDGFFVPRDTAPDIGSGVLGLHITQSYVQSERPLTIRGNSGKSNGTAQWARSLGAAQREVYFREERVGLQGIIHPALIPSPHIHVIVASALLKCKDLCFPDDGGLNLDPRTVLSAMQRDLNFEPEAYAENLRDILALAAKLGLEFDEASIPPMQAADRTYMWGPVLNAQTKESWLNVNCGMAGVTDIAQAARLVDALLPPAETYPAAQ